MREVGDATSSTAIKAELEKFHRALQKTRTMASQLSPVARMITFPDDSSYEFFSDALDHVIEDIEGIPSLIQVKTKGARPIRISKLLAAICARGLFKKYSDFPPTKTKDGAFFRAAGLMYEAATGEKADLTNYCRVALR